MLFAIALVLQRRHLLAIRLADEGLEVLGARHRAGDAPPLTGYDA